MHHHLEPVYETVRRLSAALPKETALIGFAGAPWTVATYMIAGRGKDDQAGALTLMGTAPEVFAALMARLEDATAAYLIAQLDAGAEVIKIFDSWAGALAHDPAAFQKWCIEPTRRIVTRIQAHRANTPVIGFPREAGNLYDAYVRATGVAGVAIDTAVDPAWARDVLQPQATVQGNLDPALVVQGGDAMERATVALIETSVTA
jgi:uroporphyrinogen decarboxylase